MSELLRVMISSRVNDRVGGTALRTIRERIALQLATKLFATDLYRVTRNEAERLDNAQSVVEACRTLIRSHDIILVLYNGNAGSVVDTGPGPGIGICHLELAEALNLAPARVRIVGMPPSPRPKPTDDAFREFVAGLKLWNEPRDEMTADEVVQIATEAVAQATVDLARRGAQDARRGAYSSGEALNWSRLDLRARSGVMLDETEVALNFKPGARAGMLTVDNASLFVSLSAVPDGFGIGPAREMLGQPFRNDHQHLPLDGPAVGPLHLVACHKAATAAQVRRVLGIDDATIVPTEFGVYVADEIAGTQLAFLTDCRDRISTRAHAERFIGWLGSTAAAFVMQRGAVRRRICVALAKR